MANYKDFDINTSTTLKPWGAREEQVIKDIIDTLVVDTIDVTKNTSGHLHGKLYADDSISSIDSSTSDSITITMKDDESSGLVIENRTGSTIVEIDSSTVTPKATFNYDTDVVGKLYGDLYDLYDNPMIETRHESSNIYFTSDKTGGHDFNLDTSTYTFRIHDDSTELFRIHEPVATAEATFDIPVNINGSLDVDGDIGCANIDITSLTSGYFPYDNGTKLINSPMSVDGDGDISSSTLISAGSDNATDGSIIIGSRYASSKYINTLGTLYGSGGTYFGRQLKPDTGITNAFVSGATGSNIGGGAWCIGSHGESWYTQVPRQSLTEDVTPTTVRIPFYIKEDGHIGIGTNDPNAILHMDGTSARFKVTDESELSEAVFGVSTGNGGFLSLYDDEGNENAIIRSYGKSFFNGGVVGIGTDDPDDKLHVSGGNFLLDNNYEIRQKDSGGTARTTMSLTSSDLLIIGSSAGELAFIAGDGTPTERMRIDVYGNVGIGTNDPDAKLHLSSGHFLLDNNYEIRQKDSGGTARTTMSLTSSDLLIIGSSAGGLAFIAGDGTSTERMRIDVNGNVGIGTTPSGSYRLEVNSGTADSVALFESTDANAKIILKDSDSSQNIVTQNSLLSLGVNSSYAAFGGNLNIDASGNVSIGTTPSGSYNLEVSGDASVSGKLYGDLYDLYDNPMIETRHESSNIYFTSDKTGGHDFNLDTSTYTFRIHDDSTELFRIHEPVATAEATFDVPVNINGSLDINAKWPISLGSDYDEDGVRTDNETKSAVVSSVHYDNEEENVCALYCWNDSSSSNINIGGGDANFNAVTKVRIVTAADNTTVAGTNQVVVESNHVYMYHLQGSTGENDLRYNTTTGELFYDTSALKYKNNVRNNPDTSWIYEIPVKIYDRIDGSKCNEIGIIADDLETVAPAYCSYKNGEIESYNKSDLVPVLLSEIQKHEKEIMQLKQEIIELKKAA
jgi:hypothetical protein